MKQLVLLPPRFLAWSLFLCVALAAPLTCDAAFKNGDAVTAKHRANLYDSINGSAQIDRLHAGTVVSVQRVRGDWVEVSDGVLGWAKAEHFMKVDEKAVQYFGAAIARKPTDPEWYCARGLLLHRLRQFDAALEDFDRATKLDNTYARAYHGRADVLYLQHKYDDARREYSEALRNDRKLFLAINNRGVCYEQLGLLDEAFTDYMESVRTNPRYAKGYANAGWLKHQQGDDQTALALNAKALELDSKLFDAHHNNACIYREVGLHEQAISSYTNCIALTKDITKEHVLLVTRAQSKLALGKTDSALRDVERAINTDPDSWSGYLTRGRVLIDLGRFEEAQNDLRNLVQKEPNSAAGHALLGMAEYFLGETELGEKRVRQAVLLDPNDHIPNETLGQLLKAQGAFEEAVRVYDQLVEAHPNHPVYYVYRAEMKRSLGDANAAIVDCNVALSLNPSLGQAFFERGNAKQAIGMHFEAINDYSTAVEVNPQRPEYYLSRSVSLQALGSVDESIQDAIKGVQLGPKLAGAHRTLGDAYAAKRMHNAALRSYGRAIEIEPTNDRGWAKRGNLYLRIGDTEKAVEDYLSCYEQAKDKYQAGYGLAGVYRAAGKEDLALETLDELIEEHENVAVLLREKGLIELCRGNYSEAVEHFEAARDSDPAEDVISGFLQGTTLEMAGRFEEAAELYDAMTLRHAEDYTLWRSLADACLQIDGDARRALEAAQRACVLSDYSVPEVLHTLASAHAANGEYQQAYTHQQQAIARLLITAPLSIRKTYTERLLEYEQAK